MITTFITESGSVYEVNEEEKLIRRISGNRKPTERQGEDGEWKKYHALIRLGDDIEYSVYILWDNQGHGTITSRVKEEK